MPRRTGATLIEVLVAIFVMGIGLLALLTLFPLGALTMAQAIQNDRAVQASVSASSIATVTNLRNDPNITAALMAQGSAAFEIKNPNRKSYPVFVDPIGFAMGIPPKNGVVAGVTEFPRVSPSFIGNPANPTQVFPWFMLLDEIVFEAGLSNKLGYPKQLVAGVIERDPRYTWAYLLQRPRAGDPSVADMAVVVFNGRPLSLTGSLEIPETLYAGFDNVNKKPEVEFFPAANTIRVRWELLGNVEPQIRAGEWVLDASTVNGEIRAYFYRVGGLTESVETYAGVDSRCLDIEVQKALRDVPAAAGASWPATFNAANQSRLIVMEGVAEVFEHGLAHRP